MLRKRDKTFRKYLDFLKTVSIDENIKKINKYKIGILLTPWMGLPVPWYGITIGLILKSKGYSDITFVVNDLWDEKNIFYSGYKTQVDSILKMLKKKYLKEFKFNILKLSNVPEMTLDAVDEDVVSHYANLNTIKYLGNSINDQMHEDIFNKWLELYHNMGGKIKGCAGLGWERFIIPGGMFQETGLFLKIFNKKNINIITYDSGAERYKIGINVCAAQNGNVSETANYILKQNKNLDVIESDAKKILLNRMQMRPELSIVGRGKIIQNIAYEDCINEKYDIVLFTNLEFDTAALGTHDVFKNDYMWITETIQFIIQNTNASVAIRQHPLQRQFKHITTNEESIKKLIKENDRVTFINYDEKVNSYNLIDNAKVIIVNTSTIGLEAGLLGKMVITDSHSYYSSAAFVRYCNSKEQYFDNIEKVLREEIQAKEENKLEAAVYYFLTQKCSSVLTDFTPQPDDFECWSRKGFRELSDDRAIEYMVNAIIELKSVDRQIYNDIFE